MVELRRSVGRVTKKVQSAVTKHELGSSAPLVLFSAVGVDVEERVDAFEQSRFNFVRRAVNDM